MKNSFILLILLGLSSAIPLPSVSATSRAVPSSPQKIKNPVNESQGFFSNLKSWLGWGESSSSLPEIGEYPYTVHSFHPHKKTGQKDNRNINSTNTSGAYNFSQAIEVFLTTSPQLKVAWAQLRSAEFNYSETLRKLFPNVVLNANSTWQEYSNASFGGVQGGARGDLPSRSYNVNIEVQEPLYLGGRIWAGSSLQRLQLQLAEKRFLIEKTKALKAFIELCLTLRAAEQKQYVLEQSRKEQKTLVNITRQKVRRGISASYDLFQVQANYQSILQQLAANQLIVSDLKRKVAQEIGIDSKTASFNEENFEIVWPDIRLKERKLKQIKLSLNKSAVDELLTRAAQRRPDYQSSILQVKITEEQKRMRIGEDLPQVSLYYRWGSQTNDFDDLFRKDYIAQNFGINLKVPLFSGLSSLSARNSEEEKIYAAKQEQERARRNVEAEILKARDELLKTQQLFTYAQSWKALAQKSLKSGTRAYRVGNIDILRMVEFRRGKENALLNYIQQAKGFHEALLNWHIASGDDLETIYRAYK